MIKTFYGKSKITNGITNFCYSAEVFLTYDIWNINDVSRSEIDAARG